MGAVAVTGVHPWLAGRIADIIADYPAAVSPPPHGLYLEVVRGADVAMLPAGPDHAELHRYRPALAVDLRPAGERWPPPAERWTTVGYLVERAGLTWGGRWDPPRRIHAETPRIIREWLICERLRDLGMIERGATLESMATLAAIREIERRAGLPETQAGRWAAIRPESWAAVFGV